MKQRVSSLDLKILISEIEKSIKDYRLQNIYNIVSNNRSFLLKFSVPDSKINLIVESGFKVHLTDFQRPTQQQPSSFVTKLRKHLKTKRLSNIKQVGNDRIAVLEFSDGLYYLVLEFFSAGNVILLDSDLKILSLFRLVDEHENNNRYSVGSTYDMFDLSLFKESEQTTQHIFTKQEVIEWVNTCKEKLDKKVLSINKLAFVNAAYLSSDLIQIRLIANDVNPSSSSLSLLEGEKLVEKVVQSLNECESELNTLMNTPIGEIAGFIVSKKNPIFDAEKEPSYENLEYTYEEFHPYEPIHKATQDTKFEKVLGYNKTLDKFFTTIESSKNSLKRQQQKFTAIKRLQLVKDEHSVKIEKLSNLQLLNYKKGELIMLYSDIIEECKKSVQSLLDQQMDWKNIEKLIKMEQTRGNEIAKMIRLPLNLIKNEITLGLPDNDYEEDAESTDSESDSESDSDSDNSDLESDDESSQIKTGNKTELDKTVDVVIDLSVSAFANSSRYFDAMKVAQDKQQKTEKNANMAVKNTEQKIAQDMRKLEKESKQAKELKQLRSKFWFEKFFWFISSDGYLCISGRDNNQIDLIYYRHFDNANDLLVSNDIDGALKVIIKNPYKNKVVPPSTLFQAGMFSFTATKAWENKMVTSPWFVKGADVSKRDFDGSILPSRMLNVSKEKTYLPPCQLVMGFALLWTADETTTKKYKDARKARDEELEFKLVNGDESVQTKIKELKSMLDKLGDLTIQEPENEQSVEPDDEPETKVYPEPERDVRSPGPNDQIQTKIRGKKNKLKKIKQKYGDQDEEDRKLRMSVLGTLKQVERSGTDSSPTDGSNIKSSFLEKKQRKKQQEANQLKKLLEQLEDSKDEPNEELEQAELDEPFYVTISGLLPSPNKTDQIVDCIPVFAPWSSLAKYKYKIKIQPGNLKKGKTVSDIFEFFKRYTNALEKEGSEWIDKKNLVELVNQQDALMCLTASKLKVTYPGGESGKGGGAHNKGGNGGGKQKGKKK